MKKNNKAALKSQTNGFKKQGYVKLWRSFQDDPLWKQKSKFSKWEAFEDLYLNTRGMDSPGFVFKKKIVHLKRGQLITSQRILAKRWNWSRGSVENFLKKLEKRRTIAVEVHGRGRGSYTIIIFLKYNELNPLNEVEKK